MSHKLMDLVDQLKINGFKVTEPRLMMLEVLLENQDRFMSVDAIYLEVKARAPTVNVTTVYRNLEALESIGAIDRSLFDNQITYFKLTCHSHHHHHHHHMICTSCGHMTVIDFCPIDGLKRLAKQQRFVIEGHRLEVFGVCEQCTAKREQSQYITSLL